MVIAVQLSLPFVDAGASASVLDHLELLLVRFRRQRPGQGQFVAKGAAAVGVPSHGSRPAAHVSHATATLGRYEGAATKRTAVVWGGVRHGRNVTDTERSASV